MDPMLYRYMYESWAQDWEDRSEFAKNIGTFIGSFSNYEMAKSISGEGVIEYKSSDEDFEESSKIALNDINNKEEPKYRMTRRRRRKVLEDTKLTEK